MRKTKAAFIGGALVALTGCASMPVYVNGVEIAKERPVMTTAALVGTSYLIYRAADRNPADEAPEVEKCLRRAQVKLGATVAPCVEK
jgi:hypothetical protein